MNVSDLDYSSGQRKKEKEIRKYEIEIIPNEQRHKRN